MKEFGNFKYDTEIYIKRLLKITVLWIGKFGVHVNILYHLVYAILGGFSFHNCLNIIANEFYVLQKSWCLIWNNSI